MSEFLFAYGTLQPGCAPQEIAAAAAQMRVVGRGHIRGVLYDLGAYPGAVPEATAAGQIEGTILELPQSADLLRKLDEYEGFNPASPASSLFVRELHPVTMDSGGTLMCWVYVYRGC